MLKTIHMTDLDTEEWLNNAVGINARKLESAIRFYLRKDKQKAKKLALQCAKQNSDPDLMKTAFQALALFKADDEIEQIFIDWLIEDNDPHSMLRRIANSYWDEQERHDDSD